jgi:hypothetical protein
MKTDRIQRYLMAGVIHDSVSGCPMSPFGGSDADAAGKRAWAQAAGKRAAAALKREFQTNGTQDEIAAMIIHGIQRSDTDFLIAAYLIHRWKFCPRQAVSA